MLLTCEGSAPTRPFFESCHSGLLACAQVFLQFGLLELLDVESQHSVLGGAIGSKRAQLAVALIDAGADVSNNGRKRQRTQRRMTSSL